MIKSKYYNSDGGYHDTGNKKIYLAGPFFNEEQLKRKETLLSLLRELEFDVFSPMDAFLCLPNADKKCRETVFMNNCEAIRKADIVVAITNDKDMGTIFESGYAYANNIKMIYLAEGFTGKFNLMLAESCHAYAASFEELRKILENIDEYNELGNYQGLIE